MALGVDVVHGEGINKIFSHSYNIKFFYSIIDGLFYCFVKIMNFELILFW